MQYSETELTEARKIIAHVRSVRLYAIVASSLSFIYLVFKIFHATKGSELYLLICIIVIIILGSVVFMVRFNYRTAMIFGLSHITGGALFIFSAVFYQREAPALLMITSIIAGLIVIRQGISTAFGARLQETFTREYQKKIAYVKNLTKSMQQTPPSDNNLIHCTYKDPKEKRRPLKILLLDDIACFLLQGETFPVFLDLNNVFMIELQDDPDFLNVSVLAYDHDWLEAQMKKADFRKFQRWKDR